MKAIHRGKKRSQTSEAPLRRGGERILKIKANPKSPKRKGKEEEATNPQEFIPKRDRWLYIVNRRNSRIEIRPLIQKWMPRLVILEPQELKDEYRNKLKEALKRL